MKLYAHEIEWFYSFTKYINSYYSVTTFLMRTLSLRFQNFPLQTMAQLSPKTYTVNNGPVTKAKKMPHIILLTLTDKIFFDIRCVEIHVKLFPVCKPN